MLDNVRTYSFDGFQVDAHKRVLTRDGQTVAVSSKAFDLLLALVENAGREISKEELMGRVWADQMVEDANLTVTMSQLRKALGEKASDHRFIVTIPGRGYRFVGALKPTDALIVEQHTVSQIVIDEFDSADESINITNRTKALPNGDGHQSQSRLETTAAALMPIAQNHTQPVFVGLILAVLIVSGAVILGLLKWKAKDTAPLPFAGAPIKQLTTKGRVLWTTISPDGRLYAYALNERDFKESLWLGQTDGARDIELRPAAVVHYRGMEFSPDARTLYFSVADADQASQNGLFKIGVLGGVVEKLPFEVRDSFAVAPDGQRLAFIRASSGRSALVIGNFNGAAEQELLTRPLDTAFVSRLDWSPDGKLIAVPAVSDAVNNSREIFIVSVADGSIKQLTSFSSPLISNVVWRHDGRGLVLVATDKGETVRHLWHIDYPGGNAKRLSSDTDTYGTALSISADGNSLMATELKRESNFWIASSDKLGEAKQITFSSINGVYGWSGFDWTPDQRIVFTAGIDRTTAIYSMDASGNDLKQITSAGFYDQRPSVTADGRFIVFQSNRSGPMEIWRVNLDGNDLRQLTSGGRNGQPHSTPDGKSVVYISTRNGRDSIWRVSIDGGQAVPVNEKAFLSPRVSPDGQFIASGYRPGANVRQQLAILKMEDGSPMKVFDVPLSAAFNDGVRWTPDGRAVCYRDMSNGVWRQPIEGGAPERLKGLPEEKSYLYEWSRDGKLFAFTRAREISDAVLIRNSN